MGCFVFIGREGFASHSISRRLPVLTGIRPASAQTKKSADFIGRTSLFVGREGLEPSTFRIRS